MRSWFSVALLAFISLSASVHADVLEVRQEITASDDAKIETRVFLAENAADREKIVATLKALLKEDRSKARDFYPFFTFIRGAKGRHPTAESSENDAQKSIKEIADGRKIKTALLDSSTEEALRANSPTWFQRNYKICFSVTRFVQTAGITTWSLVASEHLPLEVALPSGLLLGSVSGSMQYWNKDFQIYLKKNFSNAIASSSDKNDVFKNRFTKWWALRARKALATGNRMVAPYTRWLLLEDGFIATLQISLTALGHPPSDTFVHFVKANLFGSVETVGSQGVWDIAVTEDTLIDVAETKALKESAKITEAEAVEALTKIQLRSDFITLGVSALSVSTMVMNIMHVPHAWLGYIAVGGSGLVYKYRKPLWNRCRSLLSLESS